MPKLSVTHQEYDPTLRAAWIARRRDALPFPPALEAVRRVLRGKARARSRRTPRFFGEAFVAQQATAGETYYASFKWLTNSKFADTEPLADKRQEQCREALHRHFGQPRIEELQRLVDALFRSSQKALGKKKPTAPDLWLVDRRGHHRFIEVKLPGDSIAPHQVAGLAAIACVLNRPKTVSVEVVHLDDQDAVFQAFCKSIDRSRRRARSRASSRFPG
jgi:hypothetical protein